MRTTSLHLTCGLMSASLMALSGCGSGANSLDALTALGNSSTGGTAAKSTSGVTGATGTQSLSGVATAATTDTSIGTAPDPNGWAAIQSILDNYATQVQTAHDALAAARDALHAATIADPADASAITTAATTLGSAIGDESVLQSQIRVAIEAAIGTSLPTPAVAMGGAAVIGGPGGPEHGGMLGMGRGGIVGGAGMMEGASEVQGAGEMPPPTGDANSAWDPNAEPNEAWSHADPLIAALSLTTDQQTQLQTIRTNFATQYQTERASLDTAEQALIDAQTAATPDEAAIRTAAANLGTELGNEATIRSQELAAIRAILTADQVTQFDTLLSQGPRGAGHPEGGPEMGIGGGGMMMPM